MFKANRMGDVWIAVPKQARTMSGRPVSSSFGVVVVD